MPRARKYDGVVYPRKGTNIWWIRYRDRSGIPRRESTNTSDWQEAQTKLRERPQARDGNVLDIVKKGETLSYGQWADFYLENYSKPPVRAEKTHATNNRCAKHLKQAFGPVPSWTLQRIRSTSIFGIVSALAFESGLPLDIGKRPH